MKTLIGLIIFGLAFCNPAQADWLVKSKGKKYSYVLSEDGAITKTKYAEESYVSKENLGDPKTDFDQRENCGHGKSKNCASEQF